MQLSLSVGITDAHVTTSSTREIANWRVWCPFRGLSNGRVGEASEWCAGQAGILDSCRSRGKKSTLCHSNSAGDTQPIAAAPNARKEQDRLTTADPVVPRHPSFCKGAHPCTGPVQQRKAFSVKCLPFPCLFVPGLHRLPNCGTLYSPT